MSRLLIIFLIIFMQNICLAQINEISKVPQRIMLNRDPILGFATSQFFYFDSQVVLNNYYPDGMLFSHGIGTIDKKNTKIVRLSRITYWDMDGNILDLKWKKSGKYTWARDSVKLCERLFELKNYHIPCIVLSYDNDTCIIGLYFFKHYKYLGKKLIRGTLNHETKVLSFNPVQFNVDNLDISILTNFDKSDKIQTNFVIIMKEGNIIHHIPLSLPLEYWNKQKL